MDKKDVCTNRPGLKLGNLVLLGLVLLGSAPLRAGIPTEIQTVDQVVGDGVELRRNWFAIMHYAGWVYDEAASDHKGVKFVDSNGGPPKTFVYGHYRALEGVEKGMRGMKVGGKRTIVVPPKLGYDDFKYQKPEAVPPGSAQVFEIELLDAVPQQNPNTN
jgi:FKBP-type peptidyl-prolyl cis-trans isomerase FkpA